MNAQTKDLDEWWAEQAARPGPKRYQAWSIANVGQVLLASSNDKAGLLAALKRAKVSKDRRFMVADTSDLLRAEPLFRGCLVDGEFVGRGKWAVVLPPKRLVKLLANLDRVRAAVAQLVDQGKPADTYTVAEIAKVGEKVVRRLALVTQAGQVKIGDTRWKVEGAAITLRKAGRFTLVSVVAARTEAA